MAKKPLEGQTQIEMLNDMLNQKRAEAANDISSLIKPKVNKSAASTSGTASPSATAA